MKPKYWSPKKILGCDCVYNMVIGKRSNGKTYGCLKLAVERYVKDGSQTAIIRRWEEDFKSKRGSSLFSALGENGEIEKLTGGAWSDVYYYARRWYLCRYNEDGQRVQDQEAFAYAFTLAAGEHDKSTSYPRVQLVIFDEFLASGQTGYLTDEFVSFCNVLSTIIRDRSGVKIFMLGNTLSRYCPYFAEMGLKNVIKMRPGDIDIYKCGEHGPTVAVEYVGDRQSRRTDSVYFGFENPKLSMITTGEWEIGMYPHCPVKYRPNEVIYNFFIIWAGETFHAEVVQHDDLLFCFIHPKTTEINDNNGELLVYQTVPDPRPNYRRKINRPRTPGEKRILDLFTQDRVYYSDNFTGDAIAHYLKWCGASNRIG